MKERICTVCRQRDVASNRIRVARIDGKYIIDHKGNANGRGAYLCHACIDTAIKKRALNRSFKTNLPQEIYDELGAMK